MTAHATEAAQDQHSVDLATIASLRAQLAAANDSIARVRARESAMTTALAKVLHLAYDDEMSERLSEAITSAIGRWEADARALTPEAPR